MKENGMQNNRMMGLALLIIGGGLLFWGYDIYDSVESQLSRSLDGEAPMKAYVLLIGGALCAALGLLKLK